MTHCLPLAVAGGFLPHLILGIYMLMLLWLCYLGYRKGKATEEDYYLAGRGQGTLVTSLTIMATFFSSAALLGIPGVIYRDGVSFFLFFYPELEVSDQHDSCLHEKPKHCPCKEYGHAEKGGWRGVFGRWIHQVEAGPWPHDDGEDKDHRQDFAQTGLEHGDDLIKSADVGGHRVFVESLQLFMELVGKGR